MSTATFTRQRDKRDTTRTTYTYQFSTVGRIKQLARERGVTESSLANEALVIGLNQLAGPLVFAPSAISGFPSAHISGGATQADIDAIKDDE